MTGGYCPWESIKWRKPALYRNDRPALPWLGLDTETCRGTVRLLMDSDGGKLWDPTLAEMLEFIHRPGHRSSWYNLRYDIECILKTLSESEMVELLEENKVDIEGWSLGYIPKKRFALRRHGERVTSYHYDIAQFFSTGLDAAAERFLGEGKVGLTKVEVRELGSKRSAWDKYPPETIEGYCLNDCVKTRRLGELWDEWGADIGLDLRTPISPAFVSGIYARERGWPTWTEEMHETVGPCAWEAYSGGRFESRVKGWGRYFPYDINSAYPSWMVELPDPTVPWYRLTNEKRALGFPWGLVLASVKVGPSLEWGPLPVRDGDVVTYPTGNLGERWMTLWEYQDLQAHPDITTRFRRAWCAEDTGDRPLAWLRDLYVRRRAKKKVGDPTEHVDKVMLNAVYGKQLQKNPRGYHRRPATVEDHFTRLVNEDDGVYVDEPLYEMGPLFNPVWAAHTTAGVRLQLWELMLEFDIAAVATDGILARERIPNSAFRRGDGLGEWDVERSREGVIVGNGQYQLVGKKPKRRGFGEPLAGFDWLKALASVKGSATKVRIWDERPLHPGEIMRTRKYVMGDIGRFEKVKRDIDLNADLKRVFPPVTAGKLLDEQVVGVPLHL